MSLVSLNVFYSAGDSLDILLVLVGLTLMARTFPLLRSLLHLLIRRSLIACFAWSKLAHIAVMVVQGMQGGTIREGLTPRGIITIASIALIPATQSLEPRSAGSA